MAAPADPFFKECLAGDCRKGAAVGKLTSQMSVGNNVLPRLSGGLVMLVGNVAVRQAALALVLVCLFGSGAWSQAANTRDGPATLELRRLVESNPEIKHLLL